MRLSSLDQTHLQLQLQPHPALFASHLAIIALVIEACQVKDAMQHQNFHFVRHRMPETLGVLAGDVGRNHDVPGNARSLTAPQRRRWK
jgi:hypothetical protein